MVLPSDGKSEVQFKKVRPNRVSGSLLRRLWLWFSSNRTQGLLIGGTLMVAVIAIANKGDLIIPPDDSLQPGEISLAGAWKINFTDDSAFAAHSIEDSGWCRIKVPDVDAVADQNPPEGCPREAYPRERMANNTYWYRTSIAIPAGAVWKEPALFLGTVKDEAWIYWDGTFVKQDTFEFAPTIVFLSQAQVAPGIHNLAVRVRTGKSENPGIMHMFKRKVSLGERSQVVKSIGYQKYYRYQYVAIFILNLGAFALGMMFLLRSSQTTEKFFWLVLFFGFSAMSSSSAFLAVEARLAILSIAQIGAALSALGYALSAFPPVERGTVRRKTLFVTAMKITTAFYGLSLIAGTDSSVTMKTAAHLASSAMVIGAVFTVFEFMFRMRAKRVQFSSHANDWVVLACLTLTQLIPTLKLLLPNTFEVEMSYPAFFSIITIAAVGLGIEQHIRQQRELAFFGRFVRRGLKELLSRNFQHMSGGDKIFRGRRVTILKIDIIRHTETTFGMPYGIKRLYQDCWFTNIDEVVAHKTFMDKGLGDGSLYYFEHDQENKSAQLVIESALEIRDRALAKFDTDLRVQLDELLATAPELAPHAKRFFDEFEKKFGHSFNEHHTQARFILATGFVDEGLWGTISQGHYDIEGDLVTVAARLEKFANASDIVATESFVEALRKESMPFAELCDFEWREADLKGIGKHKCALIKTHDTMLRKKAA